MLEFSIHSIPYFVHVGIYLIRFLFVKKNKIYRHIEVVHVWEVVLCFSSFFSASGLDMRAAISHWISLDISMGDYKWFGKISLYARV